MMMASREEDEYSSPDTYQNLSEIAAPPPDENPYEERFYRSRSLEESRSRRRSKAGYGSERTQDFLETHQTKESQRERRQSEGGNTNLTELAVPPPIDRDEGNPTGSSDRTGEPTPRKQSVSRLATKIYTVSYLILFSLLGTLARLGLGKLTVYPGAPAQTGVLWANFGGCLIMGFLSEDRRLFGEEWGQPLGDVEAKCRGEENTAPAQHEQKRVTDPADPKLHATVRKTIPLFIGLATGFCGSFTSFSSFIRDLFLAATNSLPTSTSASPVPPRSGGDSFMALLAVLILTITACLGANQFGAQLAIALDPITATLPFRFTRKVLDRITVPIAFAAWLGAILLTILPPDRPGGPAGTDHSTWGAETWRGDVLFALVFAPVGCLMRFYVSLALNGRIASFPVGTFVANVGGTLVLAVAYGLQHVPLGGMVGCQVLQGVVDGFCGCLTTVSTWIAELKGLRRRHAYVYGGSSVLAGFAVTVVVMGPMKWGKGWDGAVCG
jgi:fluoride ion exporter CrcB/FEX